jgi:hypothetical protein
MAIFRHNFAMKKVALLSALLLLSACSSNTQDAPSQESKFGSVSQPTPTCSTQEFTGGSDWIKGQLEAFGESEPDKAYSYASESFKQANSLEDFASIIVSQYTMLLDLKTYQIVSCDKDGELYTFKVQITDNQSNAYSMEYVLSYSDKKWGVEGASVTMKIS